MKTYTEKELQEIAEKYYFKNVDSIIAVEDGHFFHTHALGAARIHANDKKMFELKKKTVIKKESKNTKNKD